MSSGDIGSVRLCLVEILAVSGCVQWRYRQCQVVYSGSIWLCIDEEFRQCRVVSNGDISYVRLYLVYHR